MASKKGKLPLNKIICGDALTEMKKLPSGSVDLIVTSPPYNLRNSTGNGMKGPSGGFWSNAELQKGYACYDDNMPYDKYIKWQRRLLKEMLRLLPETGAIFYNHKWRVQKGLIQDRREIIQDFPVRQIIIWKRPGGMNFNKGYFLPTYEVIYLIAKPKFHLVPKANAHGDVWYFKPARKNNHPAPFPLGLAKRCIRSTDAKIVLDPFMGSGTTAVAALQLGVKYIGIELSEDYVQSGRERVRRAKKRLDK